MGDHCDPLISFDIDANGCGEDLTGHVPMECNSVFQGSDEYDVVLPPQSGMIFGSEDEVRSYYTKYANQKGFGIMTRSSKKRDDGRVEYFVLACSKEGNRRTSKREPIRNVPKRNVSSRKQNCEAKITVSLCKDGTYRISLVVLDHNHELTPGDVVRAKRALDQNDQAGERMNKNVRTHVAESGDYDYLTFCESDSTNYIHKERRLIGKDGDAIALQKYFVRMQKHDSNFFYVIDLDDCLCVRNVFWADARSREAYKAFGDVVTVDTTYLSNQYKMPLVSFVGMNHHGQSILFGCGLLSHEDTKSFVWLFQSWLHCMSCIPPIGIITDSCNAMQKAIQIVFPSTRHRWCLCDIMKKLPQYIGGYAQYTSISEHLQNAVYNTLTTNEFEWNWKKTVEEFGLEDNEWLKELFIDRHRWVPTFVRGDFWAGMCLIQRGGSSRAFFEKHVNPQTTLQLFVDQYDNILQDMAEKEFEADFRAFCSTLSCATKSPFERQFQSAFTHAKFLEVQKEFMGKADCNVLVAHDEDSICHYNVIEDKIIGETPKEVMFQVTFDRASCDVKCMCCLFEFTGILCRHSLAVLSQERVKEVPSKYILDRWKKNIKRRHAYVKTSYGVNQLKPQMQRFDSLSKEFDAVAKVAAEFEETSTFVKNVLCDLKAKLEVWANRLRNTPDTAVPLSCAVKGDFLNNQ